MSRIVLPSSVTLIDQGVFLGDLNLVCVDASEAVYALVLASCMILRPCPPLTGCPPSSLPSEHPTQTPSYTVHPSSVAPSASTYPTVIRQSFPPSTISPTVLSKKDTIPISFVPSIKPVETAKLTVFPSSSIHLRKPHSKPHQRKRRSHGGSDIIVDSTAYTIALKKKTTKLSSYSKTFKNEREFEA